MSPDNEITPGSGDLPRLELVSPDGARAEIYLLGAHVTSWVPAGDQERLFLSRVSQFRSGAPIRGGIPVVFPQFGAAGPLPLHGFARLMPWEFVGVKITGKHAAAIFRLGDTDESCSLWQHAFLADLSVTIGGNQMEVKLGVTNPGSEAFEFTTSLHTYLAVKDVTTTRVERLAGLRYRDSAAGGIEKLEGSPQIAFTGEVNRIYFNAPAEACLVEAGRRMVIRKAGFTDTVVWNPAEAKCTAMPDLEPGDYLRFVCVEAATVGVPVRLAPGEHWEGTQTLEV